MFLTPKLVGIDIYAFIFGHPLQEIELNQFSKVAVAAILKNLKNRHFPAILVRCMGAHFFQYQLALKNPLREKGILKMVTDPQKMTLLMCIRNLNTAGGPLPGL